MTTDARRTTGTDLLLERTRKRVTVSDLARAMGYRNHSRVSQIENSVVVTASIERRYRNALSTFPDVETSTGAA